MVKHVEKKKKNNVDVALVLGAGGSRGAMLVGAMEVLEENNIPIDLIVGSSSGSIVGAMYAYYQNISIVKDKLLNLKFEDVVTISWLNYFKMLWKVHGISGPNNFTKMLSHQLPAGDIKDLPIPLSIVTTDIKTFDVVELTSGNLIQAVLASSSVPPYFPPITIDNRLLSDGGISSPVPTEVAKRYDPKVIIAVDITKHHSLYRISNMLELAYRSLDVAYYHLATFQTKLADVAIVPMSDLGATNDDFVNELYQMGRNEAQRMMPKILELLKAKGIRLKGEHK